MAAPILTLEHHGHPITVRIRGVVVDEFGESLTDAVVTLSQASLVIANARSDERGQFELADLKVKVAIHQISARKPGYVPTDEELILRKELDNTTITVGLRLTSDLSTAYSPEHRLKTPPQETTRETPRVGLLAGPSYAKVKVFFATDRNQLISRTDQDPTRVFGTDRSVDGSISFGQCEVSVPAGHRVGRIEKPSFWKLEFKEQPEKHIVLLSVEKYSEETLLQNIMLAVQNSSREDAFVFVHGYYVTFSEAVRRTAQMAFDLDFEGAAICYSWPSKGRFSGYAADEASIEWSTPHLCNFLRRVSTIGAIKTFHLIAHSMGNRAMVRCLQELGTSNKRLQQAVLAAPDIDAGVFEELANRIITAKRTTLYASSNDLPLRMSRFFHSYRRAGESGDGILVLPHIDTVDASALPSDIWGHSYYGESRTLLSDIYELFRHGTPPPRFGLRQANSEKLFWIFVP